MKSLKRIGIIVIVGAVLILLSISFQGNEILQRAIVVGMGVDFDSAANEYVVSAEIVSPGGGSDQQVGTFSKTVVGKGDTLEKAITKIFDKTGREVSLGQCILLVLGESLYKEKDIHACMAFFAYSDSFKESASVCCVGGEAADFFDLKLPLAESVSLSLVELFKSSASELAVPTSNLLEFTRSQAELSRSGFMNFVEIVYDDIPGNKDQKTPDKPQASLLCEKAVIFKDHKFITVLGKDDTEGFSFLERRAVGQLFVIKNSNVTETSPDIFTLRVNDKSMGIEVKEEKDGCLADIELKLKIKKTKTDTAGTEGILSPKSSEELSPDMIEQATAQAEKLIDGFLSRQKEFDFDIIGVYRSLLGKYGKEWREKSENYQMEKIDFTVKVKSVES